MTKTIEELVGEDYYSVSTSLDGTKYGFTALARHIRRVLGENQWNEPIWRVRVFPDGKIVELEKFEEYLLKPVREGFGIESLYALNAALSGIGREGKEAIEALIKEIPDWKERVRDEGVKQMVKDAQKLSEHGSNQYEDRTLYNNVQIKQQGTSSDYLASRIKRDAPEIAKRMERGEFKSVRAAAIEAGIIKIPSNLDSAKRIWLKMNDDERSNFLNWISNEV